MRLRLDVGALGIVQDGPVTRIGTANPVGLFSCTVNPILEDPAWRS
jgi:hypothetical protein